MPKGKGYIMDELEGIDTSLQEGEMIDE
jgi:hypothetical protein